MVRLRPKVGDVEYISVVTCVRYGNHRRWGMVWRVSKERQILGGSTSRSLWEEREWNLREGVDLIRTHSRGTHGYARAKNGYARGNNWYDVIGSATSFALSLSSCPPPDSLQSMHNCLK